MAAASQQVEEPKIVEIKPGVRVRAPDTSLKDRLGKTKLENVISDNKLQQAQVMMDQNKANFPKEALVEVDALSDLYKGFVLPIDKESAEYQKFYGTALNLKSISGLFGYPLASDIANCMLNYCQAYPLETQKSLRLLHVHLAALYRVFLDKISGDGGPTGRDILKGLRKLTTPKA